MKKYLILMSGLVASSFVFTSLCIASDDDVEQKYIDAAVNLVDAGEYRLALKVLKDCDRPFADALRMEAYNEVGRTKKAIRYGVEYLDALGKQDMREGSISMSSYVTADVEDILDKNWKYAADQIRKRLAEQACNPQLEMMLGSLYQINGHYMEAIEQYGKTLEYCSSIGLDEYGTNWLCYWKSSCYYALDDYDNAIKTMSKAVEATIISCAAEDSTICRQECLTKQWRTTRKQQRSIHPLRMPTSVNARFSTSKGNWRKQGWNTRKESG